MPKTEREAVAARIPAATAKLAAKIEQRLAVMQQYNRMLAAVHLTEQAEEYEAAARALRAWADYFDGKRVTPPQTRVMQCQMCSGVTAVTEPSAPSGRTRKPKATAKPAAAPPAPRGSK